MRVGHVGRTVHEDLMILAIDPGNEQSAYVLYDGDRPRAFDKLANDRMLGIAAAHRCPIVVEMIASYGMPVGREVFETCVWIGRFVERHGGPHSLLYRRDVKLHLCGQARAKDANIRQALIDRYGGKDKAIGRKATPGPLFGITADVWAALAVAVTWSDLNRGNSPQADIQ